MKLWKSIVHLELDKFLQNKKTQVISQCRKLLEARHKSEASVYMELWKKLLPEDTEIDGAFYLAKVSVVRTKAELEELVKELYLKIGISGKIEKKPLSEEMLYREALTLAWKRFGYPEVLADCRTRSFSSSLPFLNPMPYCSFWIGSSRITYLSLPLCES